MSVCSNREKTSNKKANEIQGQTGNDPINNQVFELVLQTYVIQTYVIFIQGNMRCFFFSSWEWICLLISFHAERCNQGRN